ncbi:hypothetical protein [Methylobacterium oxalidis]|uniref:Lipoprotein n=1 Tax=Methylobacterium oxalidis TaxID=944322 RepID=A0A512IXA4_9HYPH|nr:hypothetical protein [Methylobacterium oxalidis]GEP02229.1 hypothetical protein MOX02_02670 [Methylobacterium oxalidis]GJE32221.1 hypothetical protein LDDCCGHA_2405 [Methylobacterium oxalidis]GLS62174.1 hypothetical protein GCM10007888_05550 [Methylobacterium oxalidis]
MNAPRPFRWLLALVALVVPAAVATCRGGNLGADAGQKPDAPASVVFRHYI